MTPSPDHEEKLERFVHQALRDLPPRRAPASLESRVMAALERRATLPWWRQSFAHWPAAARLAFVAASAVLVGLALWLMPGFDRAQIDASLAPQFAWLETARGIADSVVNFGALLVRGISPAWFYGGAIAIVALYAALFGLGTAAYRTLIANR